MGKKKVAIILGGAISHILLIENLKNRDYYTVLIDYYEHPPAKEYADIHIRESTLDIDTVLEIAENLNASLIINTGLDQPIPVVCYVASKLGLPTLFSYQAALDVTDKGRMKKKMLESDIPTTRYMVTDKNPNVTSFDLRFPVVVKPVDATGSLGVRVVDNFEELYTFLPESIKLSRTNSAIIEEYFEGVEVSIDCFVRNQKANLIMLREQHKMKDRNTDGMQSIGSITPARLSMGARENLQKIADKIVKSFDLDNTPLLIQAIVKGEDANIIEIAARIGGGTHVTNIKRATGFDILNMTIDAYLDKMGEVQIRAQEYYQSTNMIYAQNGVFDKIEGLVELKEREVIEEFFVYKTSGMVIDGVISSRNRIGAYIVKGKSEEEIYQKVKTTINNIDVLDINGNSILRKDIYIK